MPARDQDIGAIKQGLVELIKLIDQEGQEPEHQGGDAGINQPPKAAAGTLLMTGDGKALFVRRRGADHAGEWSIPAGMGEGDEMAWETALRECAEEIGDCGVSKDAMHLMDHSFDNGLGFTTYGARVDDAFTPTLNGEHDAHQWASMSTPPQPLHPGLKRTLDFAMDPLTNKGEKIMQSMKAQYGPEKGEQVFYASANKGNITGVHGDAGASMPLQQTQQPSPTPFGRNITDAPAGTHQTPAPPQGAWSSPRWTDSPGQTAPGPVQGPPVDQPGINPDDMYSHTFTRKRDYPDGTSDQHVTKWTSPKFPEQGKSNDAGSLEPPAPAALKPPPSQMPALGSQTPGGSRPGDNGQAAGWSSLRFDAGTSEGARKAALARQGAASQAVAAGANAVQSGANLVRRGTGLVNQVAGYGQRANQDVRRMSLRHA
jgi:8-oxo-dGTP pyrophosphatase MutT (NUDIX family)